MERKTNQWMMGMVEDQVGTLIRGWIPHLCLAQRTSGLFFFCFVPRPLNKKNTEKKTKGSCYMKRNITRSVFFSAKTNSAEQRFVIVWNGSVEYADNGVRTRPLDRWKDFVFCTKKKQQMTSNGEKKSAATEQSSSASWPNVRSTTMLLAKRKRVYTDKEDERPTKCTKRGNQRCVIDMTGDNSDEDCSTTTKTNRSFSPSSFSSSSSSSSLSTSPSIPLLPTLPPLPSLTMNELPLIKIPLFDHTLASSTSSSMSTSSLAVTLPIPMDELPLLKIPISDHGHIGGSSSSSSLGSSSSIVDGLKELEQKQEVQEEEDTDPEEEEVKEEMKEDTIEDPGKELTLIQQSRYLNKEIRLAPKVDTCLVCLQDTPKSLLLRPVSTCRHDANVCVHCVMRIQYTCINDQIAEHEQRANSNASPSLNLNKAFYKCPMCRTCCPLRLDSKSWIKEISRFVDEWDWVDTFQYKCPGCDAMYNNAAETFFHALVCPSYTLYCPISPKSQCKIPLPLDRSQKCLQECFREHVRTCCADKVHDFRQYLDTDLLPFIHSIANTDWTQRLASLPSRQVSSMKRYLSQSQRQLQQAQSYLKLTLRSFEPSKPDSRRSRRSSRRGEDSSNTSSDDS